MENIIESTVNAEPAGNVEPQATEQVETTVNEPVNAGKEEVATSPQEDKPVQTAEDNARFAKIRREAEQRAKDAVIAEMYGQQGITTYAQYQEAIQRQQREAEAQQRGIDPGFYNEFQTMKEELNASKREKTLLQQDQQLSNHPKTGQLYNEWKNDIHSLAEEYKVDYDTAFTILARERIADVMSSQRTKAEQEAIKGLQSNIQTTPGSLASGGNEPYFTREQVASMSQQEVNRHYNTIVKSMKNWDK